MNVYISHRLVLGRTEDNQDLYRREKLAGRTGGDRYESQIRTAGQRYEAVIRRILA